MKTIFVVDDSDINLIMAKQVLKGSYRVFTAASAEKLFHLAEKVQPDLVLLDVEMPVMNGYETIKKMKADEGLKNVPVIFLSGDTDADSEKQGLALGAAGYLPKPFSPELLLKKIGEEVA
jgi:putative two-component system response regulator